jgi:DNA-directed RNA polymerase specialized sigma24 family protein
MGRRTRVEGAVSLGRAPHDRHAANEASLSSSDRDVRWRAYLAVAARAAAHVVRRHGAAFLDPEDVAAETLHRLLQSRFDDASPPPAPLQLMGWIWATTRYVVLQEVERTRRRERLLRTNARVVQAAPQVAAWHEPDAELHALPPVGEAPLSRQVVALLAMHFDCRMVGEILGIPAVEAHARAALVAHAAKLSGAARPRLVPGRTRLGKGRTPAGAGAGASGSEWRPHVPVLREMGMPAKDVAKLLGCSRACVRQIESRARSRGGGGVIADALALAYA